ncbi:hypothetical protein H5410_039009 [Solanum commersonii]|uniref:Uncharacterized protein n=1 Tax=Solanum commersonii TaxID=4109 RepID=A0A9J5YBS9_SOLCO|nr:hypothetical protein H5410_039009 [Solanum commersonii]
MPRIPVSSQRRRANLRCSSRSQNPPRMNPSHPLPSFPVTLGVQTFYATHAPEPNLAPHSWLEMGSQGQALSFSAEVEGRTVAILVQNPTFLAQPPLGFPFPQIPFYHYPTWEMPLFYPPTNMEPLLFPPFFFLHQVSGNFQTPWSNVGRDPVFTTVVNSEAREIPPQGMQW